MLVISTSSSTHVIDVAARTVLRSPDTGGGCAPSATARPVVPATLRRDHEPVALLGLGRVRHGQPAKLLLALAPGRVTVRRTTPVRDVRWAVPPTGAVPADLALSIAGGVEAGLAPALAETRDWLLGRVPATPHHLGPPCPETAPLLPALLALNAAQVLTVNSQPSLAVRGCSQRAYLDVLTSPSRAERLATVLKGHGLLVDHWPLDRPPAGRGPVVVTRVEDEPCTWNLQPTPVAARAHAGFARACQQDLLTSFPAQRRVLQRAHALLVVEPSWQPSSAFWGTIVAAAQQVQP